MTTTEDNKDQGALDVVALYLATKRNTFYEPSGKTDREWAAHHGYLEKAKDFLSALAEAGYTVVKTEHQHGEAWMGDQRCCDVRRVVGPWEPVPEGGDQ